jgi:hypothetical protein
MCGDIPGLFFFFYCSTMVKNIWYPVQSNVSGNSNIFNCVETLELPGTVTVCLTCPTSVATIFVAHSHWSFSRNIQEELEAAVLFQQLYSLRFHIRLPRFLVVRQDSTQNDWFFTCWDSRIEWLIWICTLALSFLYIFPPLSKKQATLGKTQV